MLDKAQGLKKEKARKMSSVFEKEIKQLKVESSGLNKTHDLKKEKMSYRVQKGNKRAKG